MKLVLDEPQSEALTAELAGQDVDRRLVLLMVAAHRDALRRGAPPPGRRPRGGGDRARLGQPDRPHTGRSVAAGTHGPLRPNDAIHLAVALRVGADEMVAYDGELIEQAIAAGLTVLSPGINRHY